MKKVINYKSDMEALEFNVNMNFIDWIRNNLQDYDDYKSRNFFIVEE